MKKYYAHVIWNEFGSIGNAKPVTDKVGELRGSVIDLSDLSQNCLPSENAASDRSSETNPFSVCYETRDWTANPYGGNEGGAILALPSWRNIMPMNISIIIREFMR